MRVITLLVIAPALTLLVLGARAEDAKKPVEPEKPVCGKTVAECQTAWDASQAQLKNFQAAYQLARQQRDQTTQALADAQLQAAIVANKGK